MLYQGSCYLRPCTLPDPTRTPSSELFLVLIFILSESLFSCENPRGGLDKALVLGPRGSGFEPGMGHFLFFFNFMYLELAVTFLGRFGRTTNFQILMHMPIRS